MQKTISDKQILLGFDAFRLALGLPTKHFNPLDVVRGLEACRREAPVSTIDPICAVPHNLVAPGLKCPGCEKLVDAAAEAKTNVVETDAAKLESLVHWQETTFLQNHPVAPPA